MPGPTPVVDRPLALGEIFAETVRIYSERAGAVLGVGAVIAGAIVVAFATPPLVDLALLSLAFTACFAAATRIAEGDSFREAWAQVASRAPVLAVLTLAVPVPSALALRYLYVVGLLPFAAWLALVGFSIPAAVRERVGIRAALRRSLELARSEYFHALGVAAALVIANLLVAVVLAGLLAAFADNRGVAATALAQLVVAPFFFVGLAVLYFEQTARAVSSRGRSDERSRGDADLSDAVHAERAGDADAPRQPRTGP